MLAARRCKRAAVIAPAVIRFFSQNASSAQANASSSSGQTILAERGPFSSRLKSRSVVSFDGDDALKFLQGLTSNDVMLLASERHYSQMPHPTPNQPASLQTPLYTDILNPQGRFLYDMFLYKPVQAGEKLNRTGDAPGGDNENGVPKLVADVDASTIDEFLKYMRRHILRSKVKIEDLSNELTVWQRYGGALADPQSSETGSGNVGWGGGRDLAGAAAAESNGIGWRWFKDPRVDVLGFRGVFPAETTPPLVEAEQEVDEKYYVLWRLEQGVPEGSSEIPSGEAIPLEYNMAALNAISFDKGCYVGQELIARTHHRGVIRKRLMPVQFVSEDGREAEATVPVGAELVNESGKKVGSVTTALGGRGFALLRLEALLHNEKGLRVRDVQGVRVKAVRPKWWPSEWGSEQA